MAIYKFIRIYEVQAGDRKQASERMMEALTLGVEKDFHVMDYIKSPEDQKGKGIKVNLVPPKGWMGTFLEQVCGRGEYLVKKK
jgi:hypothetical protein